MSIEIRYKLADGATIPQRATSGAVGYDLTACIDEDILILPSERKLVKTGLFLELPYNTEAQIRPRSGLALKYGVTVLNSPGTIDYDYRGEIGVILVNFGNEPFVVKNGDRIAQMVISRCEHSVFVEVEKLNDTKRGGGGYGHTGL